MLAICAAAAEAADAEITPVTVRGMFQAAARESAVVDVEVQRALQWLATVRRSVDVKKRADTPAGAREVALLTLVAISAGHPEHCQVETAVSRYLARWLGTRRGREAFRAVLMRCRTRAVWSDPDRVKVSAPPVWSQCFAAAWFVLYQGRHVLLPLRRGGHVAAVDMDTATEAFNPCHGGRVDVLWPPSYSQWRTVGDSEMMTTEVHLSSGSGAEQYGQLRLFHVQFHRAKDTYVVWMQLAGKRSAVCFTAASFLLDECCASANYLRRNAFVSSIIANAPNIFVVIGAARLGRLEDYIAALTDSRQEVVDTLTHASALAYNAMLNECSGRMKGKTRVLVKALSRQSAVRHRTKAEAVRQWEEDTDTWYTPSPTADGTGGRHARQDSDNAKWAMRHEAAAAAATTVHATSALLARRLLLGALS